MSCFDPTLPTSSSPSSAPARWGAASRRSRRRPACAMLLHDALPNAAAKARGAWRRPSRRCAAGQTRRQSRRRPRRRGCRSSGPGRSGPGGARRRGHRRGPGRQARALRRTSRPSSRRNACSRPTPRRCRSPRSRPAAPVPERVVGFPLLQSRAADEDRRDRRRRARLAARGRRRDDGAGAAHGPPAGARQGHARLHRQPRRTRLRHQALRLLGENVRRAARASTPCCASRRAFGSARSNCST